MNLYVSYYSDKNMNYSSVSYIRLTFIMCMEFYLGGKGNGFYMDL